MADPSKTEKATPKRRSELRQKGQTAKSQELNSAIIFGLSILFLKFYLTYLVHFLHLQTQNLWGHLPLEMNLESFMGLMWQVASGFLQILAPLFVLLVLTALAVNIMQVGLKVSFYPLKPDITKLNPINGFKRLFSAQPLFQLAQNLIKITIFVFIAYWILTTHYESLLQTVQLELSQTGQLIGGIVWEIFWKIGLAMFLLALVDFAWQRWYYERNIRMSKQEIKDEQKNMEGDPQIKAKVRQLQRKAALNRMMEAIPRADVVLTNPTHLAIAIEYDKNSMGAPTVIAKGANEVAQRIKDKAQEHEIPTLENKPLARALFPVEIGQEIPKELYAAVSEVLIYVYDLTGKIEDYR